MSSFAVHWGLAARRTLVRASNGNGSKNTLATRGWLPLKTNKEPIESQYFRSKSLRDKGINTRRKTNARQNVLNILNNSCKNAT